MGASVVDVGDVVGGLAAFERLIEHADGLVEAAKGVNQQLGGVEHRLEIVLVEVDRLAVVLEREVAQTVTRVCSAHMQGSRLQQAA